MHRSPESNQLTISIFCINEFSYTGKEAQNYEFSYTAKEARNYEFSYTGKEARNYDIYFQFISFMNAMKHVPFITISTTNPVRDYLWDYFQNNHWI